MTSNKEDDLSTPSRERLQVIARLACLDIEELTSTGLYSGITDVLEWMNQLSEVNIPDDISDVNHFPLGGTSVVMRDDIPDYTNNRDVILSNSPDHVEGFFSVPWDR